MNVPVRAFGALYHVGTMDPNDKSRAHESHEGNGLSVSEHPEDWARIARLGGSPTWRLDGPIRLVCIHELSDEHRQAAIDYAHERGYIQPADVYDVWWEDDDGDRYFLFADRQAAEAEAREEGRTLIERRGWLATGELRARMAHSCDPVFVDDFAVLIWVEDVVGADGVWWDDLYDPGALSCPRGVIFAAQVSCFDAHRIGEPTVR